MFFNRGFRGFLRINTDLWSVLVGEFCMIYAKFIRSWGGYFATEGAESTEIKTQRKGRLVVVDYL